jgi:flagella basal body P-ring formation protein FlgA
MMKYICLIVLTALLFVGAAIGSERHVVTLKEKAFVSGDKIFLEDIATINSPYINQLACIFILKSPSGSIGTKLSSDYIAQKITDNFRDAVVLKGAQKVHVSRKYVEISRQRLEKIYKKEVLAKSPWKNVGKIVIEDISIPRSINVLEKDKNAIQAKISPHEDFLGRTSMSLVFGNGRSAEKVRLSANLKVFADVPVVKTRINRGGIIAEDDLEVKTIDISTYPSVCTSKKECIGKRAKTSLRQGRPILQTNIEDPPLISRGDIVFIQARSNSLIIRDKGVALRDGYITERIPVRNITSGKQVVGTIIAASCIQVRF